MAVNVLIDKIHLYIRNIKALLDIQPLTSADRFLYAAIALQ